jgi:cytosine/adenosine deaminase-related metal-dependent hydrolase
VKTVLRGATVLPGGGDWAARHGVDILIDGGVIVAMGGQLAAPDDAEVVSASSLVVAPAFGNAHTHSPEMLGRGLLPMAGQPEWLNEAYADGLDTLSDADIGRAVRLCAAELVRGGAVSVTDHFRQVPARSDAVHAAARAWAASGIQARIAVGLRDCTGADGGLVGVPNSAAAVAPTKAVLALAEELLDETSPVPIGLGPSAPQRVTDELLVGLFALSRARGSFLHMHVCESVADAASCRALYGRSAVAHLDRLGVLADGVEIVHAAQVDADDLALIAARGARIVHNPVANLRLGCGVAPIAQALKSGVKVMLGTDGAGSNDSQSMLEAAKFALLAPRAAKPVSEWPTPEQVLGMATGGGVLAPGAPANLIVFDAGASAFVGARQDWATRIVLGARETDIVHVIGRGAFLMRDRASRLQ